ncbi:MAG: efflux RND transporter periplasmic adaptor subunit [Chthoniobacteraceae bacterium]
MAIDRLFMSAAGLALLLAFPACKKAAPPPEANQPKVTVARPIAKTLTEWDDFTGRLAPVADVEVRARVSGYVASTHFKEGIEVKEGDLLFTIDPRRYEAELARATAELARARAAEELASLDAARASKLVVSKAISQEEADLKLKSRAQAEATVQAAQAAVDAAKLEVEFTRVTAPIAGRIGRKLITEGNLIVGGTNGATLLTTIVALDPIYCYFDVDERSALRYRELARQGKRASALSQEIPVHMALADQTGFPHEGKIDFVDNVISSTTGSIRARGIFPNKDRLMAPGFFARVRIPGTGEYNAMLVRDTAIGSDQGKAFVYVIGADGKAVARPIVAGPMEDGLRVIREGLTAEDRVVINGLMAVRNGVVVQADEVPMMPEASVAATTTP